MQVWLQRVSVLLFFITICSFSLRYLSDHDLGFHLKGGQWIWEHNAVPDKDTYTYTVNQNDYIDSHWLFQLVVYGFFSAGGYAGVSIYVAILVTLIFTVQWRLLRRYVSAPETIVILMSAALIIQFRFHLRPELITWLGVTFYLWVYDTYRSKPSSHIWWLCAVQMVWANCHGLFLLGWVMCGTFLISSWFHQRTLDFRLLWVTLLQPVAALLTPYGIKGLLFPFYLYTRLQENNVMNNAISEFTSVTEMQTTASSPFLPGGLYYGFFIWVAVLVMLFGFTFSQRKLFEWMITAAFLFLAVKAVRNIPLFVFASTVMLAAAWSHTRLRFRLKQLMVGKEAIILNVLSYLLAIFILLLWNNGYYRLSRSGIRTGAGLHTTAYPIGVGNFINTNALDARLMNDFNTGSWLEWQLPQPVFIDGRLEVMQEKFFAEYLSSQQPDSLNVLLKKYAPQMIVFDYMSSGSWHRQLGKLKDEWRMVYADETAVLYLHKNYREEFQPLNFRLYLAQRKLTNELTELQKWEVLKTSVKGNPQRVWNALTGKLRYPFDELMKPAIFAYRNKEYKVAERLYLEFLRQTDGAYYEIFVNLGSLYVQWGQADKALFCLNKALEADAGNELVLAKIREAQQTLRGKYNPQELPVEAN